MADFCFILNYLTFVFADGSSSGGNDSSPITSSSSTNGALDPEDLQEGGHLGTRKGEELTPGELQKVPRYLVFLLFSLFFTECCLGIRSTNFPGPLDLQRKHKSSFFPLLLSLLSYDQKSWIQEVEFGIRCVRKKGMTLKQHAFAPSHNLAITF